MNRQVLSIEQMQELKELGIDTSKASCCWCKVKALNIKGFDWMLLPEHFNKCDEEHVPTFTLQDMLKYLEKIQPILSKDDECWFMEVHNLERDSLVYCVGCESDSPLETAFKAIKWCKQNNYI